MSHSTDLEGNQGRSEGFLSRLVPLASCIVPAAKRVDWVREWQAELWQLRNGARPVRYGSGGVTNGLTDGLVDGLSLGYGLLADAIWLRADFARESARGSALACLTVLAAWSLLLLGVELTAAGSWHLLIRILTTHFFGGFVFVAIPAMIAAVATYPLRPLRQTHSRPGRLLSSRARWNLFLLTKIALTLIVGFLVSMAATLPIRHATVWWSDWFELLLYSISVTIGLRWALLNQEQRCQRCLRMLAEPTRIGPPSRNFLDWNGTELACSDGHGLLHVSEMQGSWCWYDIWVEHDQRLEWSL
jgi:hypothetical protein